MGDIRKPVHHGLSIKFPLGLQQDIHKPFPSKMLGESPTLKDEPSGHSNKAERAEASEDGSQSGSDRTLKEKLVSYLKLRKAAHLVRRVSEKAKADGECGDGDYQED